MARAASLLGLLFVLLALVAPACGGDGPGCVDTDLDGFGEGCELGPDCDDRNAARTDDCDADPFATGCPCLPGLAECYPADPATRDVGVCTGGQAICRGGVWGLCEGAVLPRFETCEGSDQDCDGRVDEGVLSPCGACTPGCVGGVWGEGDAPFVEGEDTALTPAGRLTLRREERLEATVWIVNSAEATVSKIDAESATEVARYFSGGPEPSRVAVDWLGDAWVANRHFGGVSTVRKIAGDLARCVDRDGSGTIETASGPTPLEDDECVLLTVEVGGVGGVARALAVDGNRGPDGGAGGDLWVGLHDEEAILHLDGTSGAVVERFETPGFQPYAAVFDDFGTLWMISRDGFLLELPRFEPGAAPIVRAVPLACFLLYGLDVDARGRVFVTGFSCDSMSLYEPELERWTTIDAPPSVRGAVLDDAGRAWAAHTDGRVSRVRFDPLRVEETFDLRGEGVTPIESIGAAYDAFGQVWVASSSGGGEGG
ncbi:MAG TPA: hypothetical protein RMI62_33410, partial [Polyangiaceae bacterium LLY-WYZ-15_(1-7)]|nr:hypothetical protein [Polyangiaceae bacterium LLY-WYZ-15_(1-7)]